MDEIACQVFYGRWIIWGYTVVAKYMEAGMFSCRDHLNYLFRYLTSVQEYPEDLVPEYGLQLFSGQPVGRPDTCLCRRNHDFLTPGGGGEKKPH